MGEITNREQYREALKKLFDLGATIAIGHVKSSWQKGEIRLSGTAVIALDRAKRLVHDLSIDELEEMLKSSLK